MPAILGMKEGDRKVCGSGCHLLPRKMDEGTH